LIDNAGDICMDIRDVRADVVDAAVIADDVGVDGVTC
jgi:hypothetical protein